MVQEFIEFLEKIGLTEYEAKCLHVLHNLNEAKAPEISRLAQVPKTRVYDVLETLAKKELIVSMHGRPKKYRALDLEKVIEKLIEERKKEVKALEKEAEELKDRLKVGKKMADKTEKIIKVKSIADFAKIVAQEINTATNSIEGFSNLTIEHPYLKKTLSGAIEKKIKVKLIHNIDNENIALKGAEIKKQEHNLELLIIDGRKLILGINDLKKESPEYHFTVLYNEPIVKALRNHFNESWEKKEK